jgi:hypothetical protein
MDVRVPALAPGEPLFVSRARARTMQSALAGPIVPAIRVVRYSIALVHSDIVSRSSMFAIPSRIHAPGAAP